MGRAAVLACLCAGALLGASTLKVDRIALHEFEDGPTVDTSSYEYLPGETAYFSCRLSGYQVDESEKDHRRVKLSWRMEVRDAAGVLLAEPEQGTIAAELFPEDKEWLPKFLRSFTVPPFAASGEYKITVHVKDEVAGTELTDELKFRVKGHAVEPSPTLAVRNFMFVANEDDKFPMRQTVYHRGQTVWAKMDVTGYKFAEHNRFEIGFGMAVEDPEGKQLFAQPDAGEETNESYYPQRYAPGTLTINLDKNNAPGTYTLIVTVHDKISGESVEVREPFKVE